MPSLEQIVRPFQSPGVINDKKTRVTRVKVVNTQRAIIRWGSAGDGPETMQVGLKIIVKGTDVKKAFTEVSRKTTPVRIENPDDSSQFVTAQRIDEVKFTRPKPFSDNKSGQPTNTPPGNQSGPGSGSGLISGGAASTTTMVKSSSAFSSSPVNGNPNVTDSSTAGTVTTAAEKKTETSTFIMKSDDAPPP